MKNAMIDTMFLVYGLSARRDGETSEDARFRQDCATLLARLTPVRMSVINYAEYVPYLQGKEGAKIAQYISDNVQQVPMDAKASEIAAILIKKHRTRMAFCERCWNPKKSHVCIKCGNRHSQQMRINDLFIAACGAASDDVGVIFTYDFDYLENDLAPYNTEVRKPPNSSGPLFDSATATAEVIELPRRDQSPAGTSQKPSSEDDESG